jgi:hypothetical protein
LPRLWLKLSLAAQESLAEGYDEAGSGFDQMTLDALGLDRAKTIAYVRENRPTYTQFEEYVLSQNGGSISRDRIEKHNAAIRGYNHSDELAGKMRTSSRVKDSAIKDAVTLNTLEDLDEIHALLKKAR